ncbi:MAG: DUF3040 domain-containing protein [Acidimicrobiaceae bacterium]|nr:DUF3040 domain-containing protein [Acidimicrobiaceae bacterium]MDE0606171.1 DUF3040 domain-containing protein [Acidimicrobiaceae bacterium]
MPLSEDERRILNEIEDHLYESDPDLAREVAQTTIYTHAFRNLKWATLSFLVGVALMVLLLSVHYLLAFFGFAVMLASVLWFENNARKLGRAGLQEMTEHYRGGTLRDAVGGAGMRLRQRFQRPDDRL